MVVSTQLKNISQIGSFPQIEVKIKNIWNHHLDHLKPSAMFWRNSTYSPRCIDWFPKWSSSQSANPTWDMLWKKDQCGNPVMKKSDPFQAMKLQNLAGSRRNQWKWNKQRGESRKSLYDFKLLKFHVFFSTGWWRCNGLRMYPICT